MNLRLIAIMLFAAFTALSSQVFADGHGHGEETKEMPAAEGEATEAEETEEEAEETAE